MTDEELISAFIDGELPAAEQAAFELRIAAEPHLAAQINNLREQDARLAKAVPLEPVDDALLARLGLGRQVVESAPAASSDSNVVSIGTSRRAANDQPAGGKPIVRWWLAGGALAASLVLGLVMTRAVDPTNSLAADEAFQIAMTTTPSGTTAAIGNDQQVLPILSLPQRGGGYCREFGIIGSNAARGVTCQENDRWAVLALVESPVPQRSGREIAAAGDDASPAIDAIIAARGGGDPLSAAAETSAIASAWAQDPARTE